VWLTVAGALCIASSAVLIRLSGAPPVAAAFWRCALALPVLWLLLRWERRRGAPPLAPRTRWVVRLAGLFFAGDLVLFSHAIGAVGAGLATVLGNLQVLVVGLLAWWLLGERPGRGLAVALPVMAAGAALIGGLVGSGSYGADPALGTVFGVGASLLYAGYILLLRQGTPAAVAGRRTGLVEPLLQATLGATVGALVLGLATGDRDLGLSWSALGWLALLALTSQVLGWLLISVSLRALPAAITSAVLLVQPAGAVVLGALVLAERPSGLQLAGVGLVVVGVVVATRGHGRDPAARNDSARRAALAQGALGEVAERPGELGVDELDVGASDPGALHPDRPAEPVRDR
jgi:drug/metabolite transporter (DMT)-like permease